MQEPNVNLAHFIKDADSCSYLSAVSAAEWLVLLEVSC